MRQKLAKSLRELANHLSPQEVYWEGPKALIITETCFQSLRSGKTETLPNGVSITYKAERPPHWIGDGCYVEPMR